jgi:type IV pilus assembly protein PilA
VFCPKCGTTVAEESSFCKVCGSVVSGPGSPPTPPESAAPQRTDGKAIASLILGFFFFSLPAAIVAVILGHMSLSEIRKSAGSLKGEGLAIGGLVLGYMGLATIPLLIVAAIAIPNLLRARIAGNESSAVSAIRILNTAEVSYTASHPSAGYTCSLSDLRELIDPRLVSGARSGYVLALENCTAEAPGGPNVKYQLVAYPQTRNQTGGRAFCSDESRVIKFNTNGSLQACLESGSALQ